MAVRKIGLSQKDFGLIAICAIRYCQGRQTYAPELVRAIIKPHLWKLSDKDIKIMLNDCEFQRQDNSYGDPVIDKPGWIEWEKTLKDEAKKRRLEV